MMAATLLGCRGLLAAAQSPPAEPLPPLPTWDHFVLLQAGAGFNDNVTLSHAAPAESPFLQLAAEAMVFNLDPDRPQFVFTGGVSAEF